MRTLFCLLFVSSMAFSQNIIVAARADSSLADGSLAHPYDVEYVFANANAATFSGGAVDTIFLRGGTYTPRRRVIPAHVPLDGGLPGKLPDDANGIFRIYLVGESASNPVVIMPYNREKVEIVGGGIYETPYTGSEGNLVIRDLHINVNAQRRQYNYEAPWTISSGINVNYPGCFYASGSNVKLINCVLQNGDQGVDWFGTGDMMLYGNIIYNNFLSKNGLRGYNFYTHNNGFTGRRIIKHNAFMLPAAVSYNLHLFSDGNRVNNYEISGNVIGGKTLVISGYTSSNNRIDSNYFYNGSVSIRQFNMAGDSSNSGRGNYFYMDEHQLLGIDTNNALGGGFPSKPILEMASTDYWRWKNNTVITSFIRGDTEYENVMRETNGTNAVIDSNTYIFIVDTAARRGFVRNGGGDTILTAQQWVARGFDVNSTFDSSGVYPANKYVVIPNEEDTRKAFVVVYNYADSDAVLKNFDWSQNGFAISDDGYYRIHNLQDYYNDTTTVSGTMLKTYGIPTYNHTVARPSGWDGRSIYEQQILNERGEYTPPEMWPTYFGRGIRKWLAFQIEGLQDGTLYDIKDEFMTNRSAGSVDGTSPEPTGLAGSRYVKDTNSKLSISSGKLSLASGGSTYGDPGIHWQRQTRVAGKAMVYQMYITGAGTEAVNGWDSDSLLYGSNGNTLFWVAATSLREYTNSLNLQIATVSSSNYSVGTILRASGCFHFIKGGTEFTKWTLLWGSTVNSTSPLFPSLAGRNNDAYTSDFMRIPQTLWLPSPLVSDGFGTSFGTSDSLGHAETSGTGSGGGGKTWTQVGTWGITSNKAQASALSGGLATFVTDVSKHDVVAEGKLTRSAGTVGIIVAYSDADNYVKAIHDGTNAQLIKVVSGTPTTVTTAAATYSANAVIRVVVESATAYTLYYNNAKIGSTGTISDAALQTATKVGGFTDNTGNSIDDIVVYARGTGGEYDTYLDAY